MPNEAPAVPEQLPELLAALPDAADYDAVHAALMATEGGRRFLAEFAARNRHANTTMIVAAVARVEAAIRGESAPPPPPPAPAGAGELVEIAAAIDRIRTALAAGAPSPAKLAAAVERIQDLAFMLHERAVDAPLRDALDAASGELAAAADGASDCGVVELWHALASRGAEMIGERGGPQPAPSAEELPPPAHLFAMAASEGEAFAQAVASLAAAPSAEASPPVSAPPAENVAVPTPPADAPEEPYAVEPESGEGAAPPAVSIAAPASDTAEPPATIEPDPAEARAESEALEGSDSASILDQAFGDDVFVAKEASPAATSASESEVVDPAAQPAPPPNEGAAIAEDAAAPAEEAVPMQDVVAAAEEAAAPAQGVASQSTAGPEEDPADLFEPPPDSVPPAAAVQATTAEDPPTPTAPIEPAQPDEPREPARAVPPPPLRAIPRPPLSDPLAAVRDLSDEERIALFS